MSHDDAEDLARASAGAMWDDDLASQQAGIEVVDVGPGRAKARMTISESMINGHEICHGGYIFMLADSAFALACNTYGVTTVAQACDVVFVKPARLGDDLLAVAAERVRFGRNGVYDVTVLKGADIVAEFRGRSRQVGRAQS
ncbi:MAG: hydroxyphenylacetyl-CoA thioesterase PaaI [Actinomycetes bacterium]